MENLIPTQFPVSVYGKREKFSDTITKGRVRVFYKGLNRNGTYITDEFARKLINSAPYCPVKGIYDGDDYTGHGSSRSEGRIYGVVPAEPNFAWERHADPDGVMREYACFDVLYYTALYKEAERLSNCAESMELYGETLEGFWAVKDDRKCYVFTDGCFLGLQALGADVEPCFEGAAFFSREDNILSLLEKYEKNNLFHYQEQGGKEMTEDIANVVVEEEIDNAELSDAAEVKNDEEASLEEVVEVASEEITEEPPAECSVETADDEKFAALDAKIVELEQTISTLCVERDEARDLLSELQSRFTAIESERNALAAYKKSIEDEAKTALINSYAEVVSEDIIEHYLTNLDNYSAEDLDKELTYAQKKANPNLFATKPIDAPQALLPKDEPAQVGISSILARFENK